MKRKFIIKPSDERNAFYEHQIIFLRGIFNKKKKHDRIEKKIKQISITLKRKGLLYGKEI